MLSYRVLICTVWRRITTINRPHKRKTHAKHFKVNKIIGEIESFFIFLVNFAPTKWVKNLKKVKITLLITLFVGLSLLLLSFRFAGEKSVGCHGNHNIPKASKSKKVTDNL